MEGFVKAARMKLRFETQKGPLSVEDLYDLPLISTTGRINLDDIARSIHKQLKSGDDVSFVEPNRASDPTTQLRFDIVKFVIDSKIEEAKKASEVRESAQKKQKIMALISDRKDEALKGKSLEELEAMLNTL